MRCYYDVPVRVRPGGPYPGVMEFGRRQGLKIPWRKLRAGSSPVSGTKRQVQFLLVHRGLVRRELRSIRSDCPIDNNL